MGADYGAINDQVFHIWILDKMLMQTLPYTLFAPAGKAFVDAVPMAVVLGEQSPSRAATGHPQDRLHEVPAILLHSNVEVRTGVQELQELGPLSIWYFNR